LVKSTALAVLVAACAAALGAQPVKRAILAEQLRADLRRIADETRGVVGAQVIDLVTGDPILLRQPNAET
jgi:hypothetical protein